MQGTDGADRHSVPEWLALRRRYQQDLQVRQCRGKPRQHAGSRQVVYDDMPPYIPHGWKYLTFDKNGWLYVAFRAAVQHLPAAHIDVPDPAHRSRERHLQKSSRLESATASAATSIREPAIIGLPKTRAIGLATTFRATSSTVITKIGENFGYPHCHQGDIPDPKFAMGHKCSEFAPPVAQPRRARGAARHEVLHRESISGGLQGQHDHCRARLLEPPQVPGRHG